MEAWKKGAVIGGIVGLSNIFWILLTSNRIDLSDLLGYLFYYWSIFHVLLPLILFGLIVGALFDIVLWGKSK